MMKDQEQHERDSGKYQMEGKQIGKGRRVAQIKLDERTRKQILEQLEIEGDVDRIPNTIYVTRVHHEQLGLSAREAAMRAWVIVDA